jgi:hypothetical protein
VAVAEADRDLSTAPRRSRRDRLVALRPHAPVAVVGLGVVAQAVLGYLFTRDGWFFLDAWHYVLHRGAVPEADQGLFEPWGGHWQTVPILLYKLLFAVFGFTTYVPYVMVAVTLHLAIAVLSFLILRRVGVTAWVAAIATWGLLFFGSGSEAFLWDGPIPLTLGLTLVLTALLICLRSDFGPRAMLAATLLLTVAVMTSATGLIGCVVIGSLAALSRGWRGSVRVAALPVTAFAVWYALVGRNGERIQLDGWDYARVPEFVWAGMTAAMEGIFAIPGSGPVLLVAVVAAPFVARGVDERLRRLAWVGILGAFTQMTLSSMASLTFGPGSTEVSRYQYMVVVLFLPSIAILLGLAAGRVRDARVGSRVVPVLAVVALMLAYTVNGLLHERYESHYIEAASKIPQAWALGIREATADDQQILTDRPTGGARGDIRGTLIADPRVLDELPSTRATPEQRLSAEAQFYVGVGPDSFDQPTATGLESPSFQTPMRSEAGCSIYRAGVFDPRISFDVLDGAEIQVTSQSTEVDVVVARDGAVGDARTWTLQPGEPVYLASTARDAVVVATFNVGGEFRVCL